MFHGYAAPGEVDETDHSDFDDNAFNRNFSKSRGVSVGSPQ